MSDLLQINRAIDYIESHICKALEIEDISRQAGISRWHFQRIFRAMVGDTVKEYVLKRRLSLAAKDLIDSNKKIVDVAIAYEFESHEVFSRAFKRTFGMTPKSFRAAKPEQFLFPHKPKITLAYLNHLYGGITMQPIIKDMNKTVAIGMTDNFKSVLDSESDNQIVIPRLWSRFEKELRKHPRLSSAAKVGLISCPSDDAVEANMEYMAGVIWDGDYVAKGFESRSIPAGEYAEFTHRGPMRNINHTINYIYGSWLPKSGRERGDGPEIEFYPKDFNPNSPSAEMKILIPLK